MCDKELWLEMDLYWFDGEGNTPARFFDRTEDLFRRNPRARKGVSLCVGWLRDSVLCFDGDMEKEIVTCQAPTYKFWNYARLRRCIDSLKREAARRGIADFHVVIQLVGTESMSIAPETTCAGWCGRTEERKERTKYNIEGRWFPQHPEIDRERFGIPYLGSVIRTEEGNIPFYEYFAEKLVQMASACGLDGAVFRDHTFSPSYIRGNRNRYMPAEDIEENTQMFISFFRRIKQLNGDFITIGYNSGSSPVEELRSHGFDLERLCESGYLDVFIVETWASAWQDYWPAYSMGFTFQLQYVLASLAFAKNTKCSVLFLVETFDAWEPWDSIHQYESKVLWEIWAYSHAELRTPEGSRRCAGCYISWMNHGYDLVDGEALGVIADMLDYCKASLAQRPKNSGGCIVYDRRATYASILAGRERPYSFGEEFDDWCAMLQKYDTSIFTITRAEWLDGVDADFFVASLLSDGAAILKKAEAGKKVLFLGQANLLPEEIKEYCGLETRETVFSEHLQNTVEFSERFARLVNASGCKTTNVAHSLLAGDSLETLIRRGGYAVFAKYKGGDIWFWETPEWGTKKELHIFPDSFGDVEPFRCITRELKGTCKAELLSDDYRLPLNFLCTEYEDGSSEIVVGNLETGATGCSQFAVHAQLYCACGEVGPGFREPRIWKRNEQGVRISLAGHNIGMLKLR